MAATGYSLAMSALSVDGHPKLESGVHLRWQFAPALGFPPWGVDLYRRYSSLGSSIAESFIGAVGTHASPWVRPVGTFYADTNLQVVEVYADGALDHELALGGVGPVDLELTVGAVRVQAMVWLSAGACTIQILSDGVVVREHIVDSSTGPTVTIDDHSDSITSLRFSATGDAVLRSVKLWPDAETGDWVHIAGPIGLPVTHVDYPLTHGSPDDWAEASSRIPASEAARFAGQPFNDLRNALVALVESSATPMSERQRTEPDTSGTDGPDLTYNILSSVLVSSLDAMVARMLGFILIDKTASLGTTYDYKIVANHTGPGSADYSYVVRRLEHAPGTKVLPPPKDVALSQRPGDAPGIPGAALAIRHVIDVRWSALQTDGSLHADAPALYRVFADYGGDSGTASYSGSPAELTSETPIVLSSGSHEANSFFRMGADPGWHSVQVLGVDLFGRESSLSAAAEIEVVDTVPPPPPILVGARLIRAGEPFLSSAEQLWLDDNPSDAALRVRWRWPAALQAQAPDTASFRVHYAIGRLNAWTASFSSVTDNGDGTSTLVTDLDGGSITDEWVGGAVAQSGERFPVVASTAGPGCSLVVENAVLGSLPTSGRAVLSVDALHPRATDYSDAASWSTTLGDVTVAPGQEEYDETIGGLPLTTSTSSAFVVVAVGLSSLDTGGLQSRVTQPAIVPAVHREAPAAPAAPGLTVLEASRADYHGRSFFDVPVPNDADLTHHVWRALDQALFVEDRRQRALRVGGEGYYASWSQEDFDDSGGTSPDYTSWDIEDLATIAASDDHVPAFRQVTADAIAHDPGAGSETSWMDTLDGRGDNIVFYRTQAVDAVGNRSAHSAPSAPVQIPLSTRPARPVWCAARAIAAGAELEWTSDTNREMVFTLYRTTVERDAADVRYMDELGTHNANQASTCVAYDNSLAPGETAYYCVIGEDDDGNRTLPSTIVMVTAGLRQAPQGVAFDSVEWSTTADEVSLTWSDTAPFQVAVQRRLTGGVAWTSPSGLMPSGTTAYTDDTVDPATQYEYRLRLVDENGVSNRQFVHYSLSARDA